jgi:hypothetical protein
MSWLKMIFMRLICAGFFILCLSSAPTTGVAAEPLNPWENKFTMGLGMDYATGKYGTNTRTDNISAPLSVEWRPHTRFDIQLSLPYIYQSNSVNPAFNNGGGGWTIVANSQIQGSSVPLLPTKSALATTSQGNQGQSGTTVAPQGNQGQGGAGTGSGTRGLKLGQNSAQNGIGDMSLQVGIALIEEGDTLPQLRTLGYCKFPTGNRSYWLGSGEFDEGGGLSIAKSYGSLQLYLEGIWVFQGGSEFLVESGITVKDYLNYYAEIGYQATEMLVPALVLKGTSPKSEEQGGTVEGQLKLSWKLTAHTSLDGYVGTGFNKTTADLTAGISLFYNF